jgi:polysaccharide pyruvyl transferase WcaK-like protein
VNIYVFGWYGHSNLGDEAFVTAISCLWPEYNFYFSDNFDKLLELTIHFDAVFIGGGSFLDQKIKNIENVVNKWPTFFLGVGLNNGVTPENKNALKSARGVYVRDKQSMDVFPSSTLVGDLVLSLGPYTKKKKDQIIVLPNDYVSPSCLSLAWVDTANAWYAHELAKILDNYVERKTRVLFYPMSVSQVTDDRRQAAIIISKMKHKGSSFVDWHLSSKQEEFLYELASSKLCITNRLHGGIFSAITRTPFLIVSSNSKMKAFASEIGVSWINYYSFVTEEFDSVLQEVKGVDFLKKVEEYHQRVKEDWSCVALDITKVLSPS